MSQSLRPRTSSDGASKRVPHQFGDLDRVQLRHDLPEHGLHQGECGTIVHVLEGVDAYIVEFVDPDDGSWRALAELAPGQLQAA
jgi:Domain of unknown function (DUF4926)